MSKEQKACSFCSGKGTVTVAKAGVGESAMVTKVCFWCGGSGSRKTTRE
jgi:DnaJ-class molecular chaperone